MKPSFIVKSTDGQARAYDDHGLRQEMPERVVEAWAESRESVQVIEMRPEITQVENVRAMNDRDRQEREQRRGGQ